jgi:pyruvate/2-oxoglutarate dehydrogenase complex dihydrolipoamide acyltransferase (E2) component
MPALVSFAGMLSSWPRTDFHDHRACDGGTAGGFLRYVADCVESPACALGDM